jgi:hypothetical protein
VWPIAREKTCPSWRRRSIGYTMTVSLPLFTPILVLDVLCFALVNSPPYIGGARRRKQCNWHATSRASSLLCLVNVWPGSLHLGTIRSIGTHVRCGLACLANTCTACTRVCVCGMMRVLLPSLRHFDLPWPASVRPSVDHARTTATAIYHVHQ